VILLVSPDTMHSDCFIGFLVYEFQMFLSFTTALEKTKFILSWEVPIVVMQVSCYLTSTLRRKSPGGW